MLKPNPDLYEQALEYKVKHQGICRLLKTIRRANLITLSEAYEARQCMNEYLKSVGMYSGDTTFPIGSSAQAAMRAFRLSQSSSTLWSKKTKYGQTRIDVFKAIIDDINKKRKDEL